MGLLLLLSVVVASPALAQKIVGAQRPSHTCYNSTVEEERLVAPKGTISYYDFVEKDLALYLTSIVAPWGRYDAATNEYKPAPVVAFRLQYFFTVEVGSLHHGAADYVGLSIGANECHDLILRSETGDRAINHISAHLDFRGEGEQMKAEHVGLLVDQYARPFYSALMKPYPVIQVVTRVSSIDQRWTGDRIDYVDVRFEILDYRVREEK
jgi:hypothetical protein